MNVHHEGISAETVQDIRVALARLTPEDVPSGIIYDPLLHTLDGPKYGPGYDGPISWDDCLQILFEMRHCAMRQEIIPETTGLIRQGQDAARKGEVPMALVNYDYHSLKSTVLNRFRVQLRAKTPLALAEAVPSQVLKQRKMVFCHPLISNIADGSEVVFSFEAAWRLSNNESVPQKITFDAGDGKGPRSISYGSRIPVRYTTTGKKQLVVHCEYGAYEATTHAEINVKALSLPQPDETIDIELPRPYRGVRARGTIKIYRAPGRTNVEKPLFVWTGFNTGVAATAAPSGLLDFWNATAADMLANDPIRDFLETARQAGFDIVFVEFNDPRTYIQANSGLVSIAIQLINERPSRIHPGVIVTGSMGGLIARHALLAMEAERIPTHITKAVFLDSPFKGASVPMALQYQLDFFSDKREEARRMRDGVLDSPGARQMLIQKYRSHWVGQDDPQPDPLFDELQAEFTTLGGWPKSIDLYAVASGNNAGNGQKDDKGNLLPPKAELMNYVFKDGAGTWCAGGRLFAMPNFPTRDKDGFVMTEASRAGKLRWKATVHQTLPWDTCPGGHYGFVKAFADVPWTEKKLFASNTCFVPTLSALGVNILTNLYQVVSGPSETPFKDFYAEPDNTAHAQLTSGAVAWIRKVLGI